MYEVVGVEDAEDRKKLYFLIQRLNSILNTKPDNLSLNNSNSIDTDEKERPTVKSPAKPAEIKKSIRVSSSSYDISDDVNRSSGSNQIHAAAEEDLKLLRKNRRSTIDNPGLIKHTASNHSPDGMDDMDQPSLKPFEGNIKDIIHSTTPANHHLSARSNESDEPIVLPQQKNRRSSLSAINRYNDEPSRVDNNDNVRVTRSKAKNNALHLQAQPPPEKQNKKVEENWDFVDARDEDTDSLMGGVSAIHIGEAAIDPIKIVKHNPGPLRIMNPTKPTIGFMRDQSPFRSGSKSPKHHNSQLRSVSPSPARSQPSSARRGQPSPIRQNRTGQSPARPTSSKTPHSSGNNVNYHVHNDESSFSSKSNNAQHVANTSPASSKASIVKSIRIPVSPYQNSNKPAAKFSQQQSPHVKNPRTVSPTFGAEVAAINLDHADVPNNGPSVYHNKVKLHTTPPESIEEPNGEDPQEEEDQPVVEDMAIRVVVRKRPISKSELSKGDRDILEVLKRGNVLVHEPKTKVDLTKVIETQSFTFDDAFQAYETNEAIYGRTIKPLVNFVFEGGKASCFAYGQTGSGKTFSMMGSQPEAPAEVKINAGLYVLAARDVFNILKNPKFKKVKVYISCFEIYGGKLYDLLNERSPVKCLEDSKQQVQLPGLTEHLCRGVGELLDLMSCAHTQRSTGSTGANAESSRSHQIMQLLLREDKEAPINHYGIKLKKEVPTNASTAFPGGKLSFIDLAGSERGADTTHSSKQTRMEGAEINTSLLALKEVIRSLERKHGHTPFRGSKLTQVLKDSFVGERTRTCMIACVSPSNTNCEHTLNTLRYADRVKEHQSGGASNHVGSSNYDSMAYDAPHGGKGNNDGRPQSASVKSNNPMASNALARANSIKKENPPKSSSVSAISQKYDAVYGKQSSDKDDTSIEDKGYGSYRDQVSMNENVNRMKRSASAAPPMEVPSRPPTASKEASEALQRMNSKHKSVGSHRAEVGYLASENDTYLPNNQSNPVVPSAKAIRQRSVSNNQLLSNAAMQDKLETSHHKAGNEAVEFRYEDDTKRLQPSSSRQSLLTAQLQQQDKKASGRQSLLGNPQRVLSNKVNREEETAFKEIVWEDQKRSSHLSQRNSLLTKNGNVNHAIEEPLQFSSPVKKHINKHPDEGEWEHASKPKGAGFNVPVKKNQNVVKSNRKSIRTDEGRYAKDNQSIESDGMYDDYNENEYENKFGSTELIQKTVGLLTAHKLSIAEMVEVMKDEMELVQEMENIDERDSDLYVEKLESILNMKSDAILSLRNELFSFQSYRGKSAETHHHHHYQQQQQQRRVDHHHYEKEAREEDEDEFYELRREEEESNEMNDFSSQDGLDD